MVLAASRVGGQWAMMKTAELPRDEEMRTSGFDSRSLAEIW